MFAIITPALITGAFAERFKFTTYLVFLVIWSTVVYSPITHWVWGGGWISELGALDFAGGTVIHINAGMAAIAAALLVGKRRNRGLQPNNAPYVVLGAAILWLGWFGFNAGSSLAADGIATNAFVVTNTAAATAMIAWLLMSWLIDKKPSAVGAATGAVAGLVAITPAAGFVGPMPALVIGLGAGVFCYGSVKLVERFRVDDALAVFGVHGMGGVWGALATGLFVGIGFSALGDGVSRGEQIVDQLIGIGASAGWAFVVTGAIMLVLKYVVPGGIKANESDENAGLDATEHGESAYE